MRLLRHLFASHAMTRWRFSSAVTAAIEQAVAAAELRTSGEIRFAVESDLGIPELRSGKTPRDRAREVFGELNVWDTELRNGVLIYVLMADRDVEIVADRAAAARITAAEWEAACQLMEGHFRAGRFSQGSVAGVAAVGALLEKHFPTQPRDRNEQPDQPNLL